MTQSESIVRIPGYEVISMEGTMPVVIRARYTGSVECPACGGSKVRTKDRFERRVQHESLGIRRCYLHLEARKYVCLGCGRYFHQRFPGILPYRRSTEGFRQEVFEQHRDGISQRTLAERKQVGTATVERWFRDFLARTVSERTSAVCPRVLGIDEHFFTRKDGFATTFCDLQKHRVYDVVLGRSEASLDAYLVRLEGKERVRVVCMDLSTTYRSIVRKHFPKALIVADRFHVIRLIGHHIHQLWRQIDPQQRWNRGLLSLVRRRRDRLSPEQVVALEEYFKAFPAIEPLYRFKQELWELLRPSGLTPCACRPKIRELLARIQQLKDSSFATLVSLGQTLESWQEEIARMWRFSRNNGITEGFHTKMEMISRRAYGFRNFENYRLRVKALCA